MQQGSPKLIFPDASTHASGSEGGSNGGLRSASAPLVSGDFVDLGTLKAGQKLDFFIIANGAENNPGLSQIWTANAAGKSDGLHHVSAYAVKDSPYLILNFSTTGGGDKSSRNLVFAVEIGSKNIMALANPEPHAILTFVLLGATVCVVRRRMGRSPESVPA